LLCSCRALPCPASWTQRSGGVAWDGLAAKEFSPFLLSTWVLAWWRTVAEVRGMRVAVLWRDGQLVAGLPLQVGPRGWEAPVEHGTPPFYGMVAADDAARRQPDGSCAWRAAIPSRRGDAGVPVHRHHRILRGRRVEGENGSALAHHPKMGRFFAEFARNFHTAGMLRFSELMIDEQLAAVAVSVIHQERCYTLKIAYEFSGSEEEYERRFATGKRDRRRARVYRPNPAGGTRYVYRRRLRPLLRDIRRTASRGSAATAP
jgi:CelD/BcsL family acetyltransferase involved in cellulose biosynthesis